MYLTTKKGYGFFETASALQKAIRRADEETAMYFMVELFNSGYDEFIWKRLRIITSEDVGLADPNMPANINALYQAFADLKKEKKDNRPERLFLVHATIALCRAPKSRLLDLYMIKCWRGHEDHRMEIPDYAFDKHTAKGKAMGRGVDHFHNEGSFCHNHVMQDKEAEVRAAAIAMVKLHPGKLSFATEVKGRLQQKSTMFNEEIQ